MFRLSHQFENNDYVTAEIIYNTAHVCFEVLAWSRVVCSYVVLCYARCYGYCVSQKRINVSAILMPP